MGYWVSYLWSQVQPSQTCVAPTTFVAEGTTCTYSRLPFSFITHAALSQCWVFPGAHGEKTVSKWPRKTILLQCAQMFFFSVLQFSAKVETEKRAQERVQIRKHWKCICWMLREIYGVRAWYMVFGVYLFQYGDREKRVINTIWDNESRLQCTYAHSLETAPACTHSPFAFLVTERSLLPMVLMHTRRRRKRQLNLRHGHHVGLRMHCEQIVHVLNF